ncbi:MAG: DUF1080 domain-containing protein [Planctomycetota bacterium]
MILLTTCVFAQQDPATDEQQDEAAVVIERDFAFQGEYVGEIGPDGEKQPMGMQVIALGNGQFSIKAFNGGLPGDGWNGEEHEKIDVVGQFNEENGAVEFRGYHRGDADIFADGRMLITTPEPGYTGELNRVVRNSETLGMEPPEGAVVLFDGSSIEGWENGRMSDDGFLMQGTTSKQTFNDHTLHVEFLLPFEPEKRGQGRGNSGLYVQGRYEVQMLDSFGLEGKHNECGGIYSVKDPDLNMCFPPMSWQTYDIEFTAARFDEDGETTSPARMTVRHNGVIVHDDVELPNRKTTAGRLDPGPEPGPVYLQDHSNQVRYRNIWAVEH